MRSPNRPIGDRENPPDPSKVAFQRAHVCCGECCTARCDADFAAVGPATLTVDVDDALREDALRIEVHVDFLGRDHVVFLDRHAADALATSLRLAADLRP